MGHFMAKIAAFSTQKHQIGRNVAAMGVFDGFKTLNEFFEFWVFMYQNNVTLVQMCHENRFYD